jgi:hypothetical protein
MSQWGTRDRREIGWLIMANNNSTTLMAMNTGNVGNSTSPFTAANGFVVGNSVLINANATGIIYAQNTYAIANIVSGNVLTLDTVYTGANTLVANIAIQESPKDIRSLGQGTLSTNSAVAISVSRANTTVTKRNVFGVDRTEVGIAGNKANGFSQPGWTHYKTWTTTQGMVRHRAEVLVASSKNFNANATGVLNQTDAFDGGTNADRILPNS